MRRVGKCFAWAMFFGLCAASAKASFAQGAAKKYYPSRPTVSPYLNVNRGGSDGVGAFYSIVRGQQQQQQINQAQQGQLNAQGQALQSLEQQVGVAPANLAPTGTSSTFMNTSHYYPSRNPRSVTKPGQR